MKKRFAFLNDTITLIIFKGYTFIMKGIFYLSDNKTLDKFESKHFQFQIGDPFQLGHQIMYTF